MYNFATLARAIAGRFLPISNKQGDGQDQALRTTPYGDLMVQSIFQKQMGLADEESSFATTGTIGTGIATITAPTSLADTSPFAVFVNTAPAGGPKCFLDLVKLICTAAGTGGTSLKYAIKTGPTRAAITGMAATWDPTLSAPTGVPQNVSAASQRAAFLRVYAGALVAPAALAGTKQVWGGALKNAIMAAADQYLFSFGQVDAAAQATQVDRIEACPAVVIEPGYSAFLHLIIAGPQSAASSYELGVIHHER